MGEHDTRTNNPARIVYYVSVMFGFETLVRNLCACAIEARLRDAPRPWEADMLWPRGDGGEGSMAIHVNYIKGRLSSGGHMPIEELVAAEVGYDEWDRAYTRDYESLKRADAVVFVVDDQAHRFKRHVRNVEILRADLRAAGRVPEDVPVVFQIDHVVQDLTGEAAYITVHSTRSVHEPVVHEKIVATASADLIKALTWPRCAHVEAFPKENRGAREALDRAIELYEASQA